MKRPPIAIQAGSMADIAFLLLIFFLVSTTIDDEQGLRSDLPPQHINNDGVTPARNALEVKINRFGELLVEGEPTTLGGLSEAVKTFYLASGIFEEEPVDVSLPERDWITRSACKNKLNELALTHNPESRVVKKWKAKLDAVSIVGPYRELPKSACILVDSDAETNYDDYIAVQDAVKQSLHELRANLCTEKVGRGLDDLDAAYPPDIALINMTRLIYPSILVDI